MPIRTFAFSLSFITSFSKGLLEQGAGRVQAVLLGQLEDDITLGQEVLQWDSESRGHV